MSKALERWYELNEDLKRIKVEEMQLRKKLFGQYFGNPVEGTNTASLSKGYVLKGIYKLNRKVNENALLELQKENGMDAVVKACVVYKPELVKKEYNKLTDAQRAKFDNALVITEGAPTLSVVLPKKKAS
jgi:hypothetical protein